MATELNAQAIEVTTRATAITLAALKSIIQTLIENRHSIEHGEQGLKKLNLQNKQLESVELSGEDIKDFKKQLNKYSVDFSVMKDKTTGHHTIYFKAQDTDRVYTGLENCIKNLSIDRHSKKPIKEVIESAVERAAQQTQPTHQRERGRTADRGQEI